MTSPPVSPARLDATESFQTQGNIIIKLLGQGLSGKVYAFISQREAKQILGDFKCRVRDRDETLEGLRASTKAVKFVAEGFLNGPSNTLRGEIHALQDFNRANHPSIVDLAAHGKHRGDDAWYIMELLSGGTLESFIGQYSRYPAKLSKPCESFAWHVVKCMADALLLVHFGVIGEAQLTDWPGYYHCDIKDDNILFRMPRQGQGFRGFPDVVLADFGIVGKFGSCASQSDRATFSRRQKKDVEDLAIQLGPLLSRAGSTDSRLVGLADHVRSIRSTDGSTTNAALKNWLKKLSKVAGEERERLYEPLAKDVQQYFSRPAVSDADLVSVFPQLGNPIL